MSVIRQTKEAKDLLDDLLKQIQDTDTRHELMNLIRKIESDNIRTAENPKSTAKGVYQFTDDSVLTAKTRAKQLGIDKRLLPKSNNPKAWTDDEADVMFLANLFNQVYKSKGPAILGGGVEMPGVMDDILVQAFSGDRSSMYRVYDAHHTNINEPLTLDRLMEILPPIGPLQQYNYKEKFK